MSLCSTCPRRASCSRPCLGLFGCTAGANVCRPYPTHRWVQARTCGPCYYVAQRGRRPACRYGCAAMRTITVGEVLGVVNGMLANGHRKEGGTMRNIVLPALLLAAGCSLRLPTPEQRARLAELRAGAAELTTELDAAAVEVKAVMDGVRAGTLSPEEAGARLGRVYARKAEVEKQLLALRAAEQDLRGQGVNVLFIVLSALGGIASALLGGKARALQLVGMALSRTLEKAKTSAYRDGDTSRELAKAGASPALAEKLRRESA